MTAQNRHRASIRHTPNPHIPILRRRRQKRIVGTHINIRNDTRMAPQRTYQNRPPLTRNIRMGRIVLLLFAEGIPLDPRPDAKQFDQVVIGARDEIPPGPIEAEAVDGAE